MALLYPDGLFIHVPKCAGIWVRSVISGEIGKELEFGPVHGIPHDINPNGGGKAFAVVRHPAGWLRSIWTYRQNMGWYFNPTAPAYWPAIIGMTQPYRADTFEAFVDNILENKPGLVSTVYQLYYHPFVTYFKINEMHNLVEWLGLSAGEVMQKYPPLHVTRNKPNMTDELVKRIEDSEPWVMDTFKFNC